MLKSLLIIRSRLRLIVEEALNGVHLSITPLNPGAEMLSCRQLEGRVLMSATPANSASIDASEAEVGTNPPDAVEDHSQHQTAVSDDQQETGKPALELVVVDPLVDNYGALISDLEEQTDRTLEVVILQPGDDGIHQVTAALRKHGEVSAIHLISHGAAGQIRIGNTLLNEQTFTNHSEQLNAWGDRLVGRRELLVYGCNLASTDDGRMFTALIAEATNANVAVSTDATGSAQFGGDWELEYRVGQVTTPLDISAAGQQSWEGLLATINVTQTSDVVNGNTSSVSALIADDGGDGISLREAIIAANANHSADVIQLAAGIYRLTANGSGEDFSQTGDLDIRHDLTIYGAGADSTTIDASMLTGIHQDRVFQLLNHANVTIDGITVTGGRAVNGAGIWVSDVESLVITNSVITGNSTTSGHGGGLFNGSGDVRMKNVTISGNSTAAGRAGGGIFNASEMVLNNVTISGNTAEHGGGIANSGANARLKLQNTTLSGNRAGTAGGGMAAFNPVEIAGSTIAFNRAAQGGGISNQNTIVQLESSILAGNTKTDGTTADNASGSITSLGYNIDSDGSAGLNQTGDQSAVDPLLDTTLRSDDGLTATHALQQGSPAIDAGHVDHAPITDQHDRLRGATPDIGAVESNPTSLTETSVIDVNAETASSQETSRRNQGSQQAVALSANGQYVVTWSSRHRDGSNWDIYARLYDRHGKALTSDFLVNQRTTNDQQWSSVATDAAGNFVVTWTTARQDGTLRSVYARRFDSTGNALSNEFRVNSSTSGNQDNSTIAMNSSGQFVIVWQGQGSGDSQGVFARRYDASGAAIGREIRMNTTTTGSQRNPSVAIGADGQFVVTWEDDSGIHASSFDETGSAVSGQITVDSTSAAHSPDVAISRDNNFTVVWHRDGQSSGTASSQPVGVVGDDVFQRSFNFDGTDRHAASIVNSDLSDDQRFASIAMDADGNAVITWQGSDSSGNYDVYFRKFDSDGNSLGSQSRVNVSTSGQQYYSSVQMLNPDHFVVVWSGYGRADTEGIMARQFGSAPNQSPVAQTDSAYTINEGESLTLDAGSSSDPEDDPLTFAWDLDGDGQYDDASGDSPTIAWSALPADLQQNGTYTISVQVSDDSGNSDTADATLTISNTAPVFTSPTAVSVQEGETDAQTVTATDPADSVSYSLTGGSDQMLFSIDSSTGLLKFRTPADFENPQDNGSDNIYEVRIQADDGDGGTTEQVVRITVTDRNDSSPVVSSGQSFSVSRTAAADTVVGSVVATDSDDGTSFSNWKITDGNVDSVFAIDAATGQLSLANPAGSSLTTTSSYQLKIQVSDGIHNSQQETVQINITDRRTPTTSGIPDINAQEDEGLIRQTLANHFTFPSGASPKYTLAMTEGDPEDFDELSVDANSGLLRVQPAANASGNARLRVTAATPDGQSVSADFAVNIAAVNDRPTVRDMDIQAAAGTVVNVGNLGVLASASDVDGDTLTAHLVSRPSSGSLVLNSDGSFVWQPEPGFTDTTSFTFRASDGTLNSDTATVTLTIIPREPVPLIVPSSSVRSTATSRETTTETDRNAAAYWVLNSDGSESDDLDELAHADRLRRSRNPSSNGFPNTKLPQVDATAAGIVPETLIGLFSSAADDRSSAATSDTDARSSAEEDSPESSGYRPSGAAMTPYQQQLFEHLVRRDGAFSRTVNDLENRVVNDMSFDVVVVHSAAAVGTGLAVGSVVWAVRGGLLLSSLLAQMPAWTMLDPLMVLDGIAGDDDEGDSIRDIVDRQKSLSPRRLPQQRQHGQP